MLRFEKCRLFLCVSLGLLWLSLKRHKQNHCLVSPHLRVSVHVLLRQAAGRGLVVLVFVFDRALRHHPETGSARVSVLLATLHRERAGQPDLGGRLMREGGF